MRVCVCVTYVRTYVSVVYYCGGARELCSSRGFELANERLVNRTVARRRIVATLTNVGNFINPGDEKRALGGA